MDEQEARQALEEAAAAKIAEYDRRLAALNEELGIALDAVVTISNEGYFVKLVAKLQ